MMNIATWIVTEKNKNNPFALDTFTDFTAKAIKQYKTFSKRCDMFAEVYGVKVNEAQRERLHKWLCGYTTGVSYADMIKTLCALAD